MRKLIFVTLLTAIGAVCVLGSNAHAASKAPTAEQRKKMYAQGLKNCRKKYGSQLHFVRVEKFYGRWGAVCYHY